MITGFELILEMKRLMSEGHIGHIANDRLCIFNLYTILPLNHVQLLRKIEY